MLRTVKLILGEASEQKMRQLSLSINTVQHRYAEMSSGVKERVLLEVKAFPLFSIQLDESTGVSSCSQLIVFVKYVHKHDLKVLLHFLH